MFVSVLLVTDSKALLGDCGQDSGRHEGAWAPCVLSEPPSSILLSQWSNGNKMPCLPLGVAMAIT